jgi:hypothetical protein
VLVWISVREGPARSHGGFAAYVAALLAAWAAVSYAGLDAAPRWERAARFAEDVDRLVPSGEPLILESGEEEVLVYYGNRQVIRSRAKDWLDAHPDAADPYFVCQEQCDRVSGDVISAQRERPASERMILLRASPATRAALERGGDFVCGQAVREEALR